MGGGEGVRDRGAGDRARGRRAAGAVLVGALTFGVLWSNALAYHDVWLAPRPHLRELEEIGERFAGKGPALMTEYEPYGVRHFLRRLEAEGASELRRRLVPLRDGRILGKQEYVDLDQFRLPDLLVYRTLVLRRSPVLSRPPSPYSPAWSGRYYEVWEQGPGPRVLEHLPLGDELHAAAVPRCADVLGLAEIASRAGGRLAAAPRAPAIVVPLAGTVHPEDWVIDPGNSSIVVPGSGRLDAEVTVPSAGRYEVWLGGSFKRRLEVLVDGQRVSSVRHRLNNTAQYNPLGEVSLAAGRHRVTLRYGGSGLLPGSGGQDFAVGPLVVSPSGAAPAVAYVEPGRARSLCGRTLDWIEAVGP